MFDTLLPTVGVSSNNYRRSIEQGAKEIPATYEQGTEPYPTRFVSRYIVGWALSDSLDGAIMNVFTYPEHRGKGYATSVMNSLIVDADNIFVSVLDLYSTKAGKRLYEKLGFKEVGYSVMRLYTNE